MSTTPKLKVIAGSVYHRKLPNASLAIQGTLITATYLGAILTDDISNATEHTNQLADCNIMANKLIFWNSANTTYAWKRVVVDAVISD